MTEGFYRVAVTREGRNWLAEVPQLQGVHTYADNLAKLERYVREAIGLALDLPGEEVYSGSLDWEYKLGDRTLDDATAKLRADRARLDEDERRLAARTEAAAVMLRGMGLSTRDVSRLVAISPARVSQLVPTTPARYHH